MNKLMTLLAVVSLIVLAACTSAISDDHRYTPLINGPYKKPVEPQGPPTYIQPVDAGSLAKERSVTINAPNVTLMELFARALPDIMIEPQDRGVDLRRPVSAAVNRMPISSFLAYMTSRTDYDFILVPGDPLSIRVASVATRTWNLAALTSAQSSKSKIGSSDDEDGGGGLQLNSGGGTSGGSGSQAKRATELTLTNEQDEWDSVIGQLRALLGADDEETGPSSSIVAIRSIGLVNASGSPRLIHQADDFIKTVQSAAGRGIHLSMTVHEVTLRDSKSTGVNWSLLTDGLFSGGDGLTSLQVNGGFPGVSEAVNPGVLSILASATYRDDALSLLTNFLAQFGRVTLLTQPNLTVANGRSATLNSGEEIPYVESVIQNSTSQGTTSVVPVIARALVGVEFSITPKIQQDGRIRLEVVPVVSTLKSFQTFTFQDSEFQSPRIAINELATQVIVRPGQTVHIGGLITDRLAETVNRLPVADSNIFDRMFRADTNDLERRELILTITPTLI